MSVVSLSERRKYPRISDAIALRLESEQTTSAPLNSTPTHVVKMSCGGLRFAHNTTIEAGTSINLCMHLPSSGKTINVASRVISSGEEKSTIYTGSKREQYYVQVEFQNVDQSVQQLLADHIDYVIDKTGMTHRAIPA